MLVSGECSPVTLGSLYIWAACAGQQLWNWPSSWCGTSSLHTLMTLYSHLEIVSSVLWIWAYTYPFRGSFTYFLNFHIAWGSRLHLWWERPVPGCNFGLNRIKQSLQTELNLDAYSQIRILEERWGQIQLSVILEMKDNCLSEVKFLYVSETAMNNE